MGECFFFLLLSFALLLCNEFDSRLIANLELRLITSCRGGQDFTFIVSVLLLPSCSVLFPPYPRIYFITKYINSKGLVRTRLIFTARCACVREYGLGFVFCFCLFLFRFAYFISSPLSTAIVIVTDDHSIHAYRR